MMLRKYWFIIGILDVPILILLWRMGYYIGFWICLVLILLTGGERATEVNKREKELDL